MAFQLTKNTQNATFYIFGAKIRTFSKIARFARNANLMYISLFRVLNYEGWNVRRSNLNNVGKIAGGSKRRESRTKAAASRVRLLQSQMWNLFRVRWPPQVFIASFRFRANFPGQKDNNNVLHLYYPRQTIMISAWRRSSIKLCHCHWTLGKTAYKTILSL